MFKGKKSHKIPEGVGVEWEENDGGSSTPEHPKQEEKMSYAKGTKFLCRANLNCYDEQGENKLFYDGKWYVYPSDVGDFILEHHGGAFISEQEIERNKRKSK